MKKFLVTAMSLVLLIIFTSCSEISQPEPIVKKIGFTAETIWEGEKYKITAETDGEMNIFFTVSSPERISDYKFSFSGDFVKFNYLELKEEYEISDLPSPTPCSVIYHTLLNASKNDAKISESGDKYFTETEIGDTEYRLLFGESGLPYEISSDNNSILLKNISILN